MVASTQPLAALSQKLVKSRHCLHATELKCESSRTECETSKQTVEKNDAAISAMEEHERKLKMQCACARTWFLAAAVDGDVSELRLPTYCPLTSSPSASWLYIELPGLSRLSRTLQTSRQSWPMRKCTRSSMASSRI